MSDIAKNTVINMSEDLTMMVGYSMVNGWITDLLKAEFPPEVDENGKQKINYALEVLSGGASFLFMSAMMEVIRREEKFVEYLFAAGEAVITVLYARNKGYFDGMVSKIKSLKGFKASSKARILSDNTDKTNSFVGQVYAAMQTILHGRNTSDSVASTIQASNSSMDTAINREAHDLRFANLNNRSFTDSIDLKMKTGTFTEADRLILQKVIGRNNFSEVPLDISEINKIHEFMFIKDSNGKFIGLTRVFTDLINGLAFLKS